MFLKSQVTNHFWISQPIVIAFKFVGAIKCNVLFNFVNIPRSGIVNPNQLSSCIGDRHTSFRVESLVRCEEQKFESCRGNHFYVSASNVFETAAGDDPSFDAL